MAIDLLSSQDSSGALPEQLSRGAGGGSHPPKSNAAYGTTEATLLQQNGDPVSDLLYTMNFAFLGLHEAAAATGDRFYSDGEDRIAEFFSRVQMKSSNHPELEEAGAGHLISKAGITGPAAATLAGVFGLSRPGGLKHGSAPSWPCGICTVPSGISPAKLKFRNVSQS